MRNLLGRLHARDDEELARIASFWRVPMTGGKRPAQIAALFRALSDLRAVRAVWDRLPADERAMVRLLAVVEDAAATPTLVDLAAWLGVAEAAARETAIRLYRVGILARERDEEPLPIGAVPRLFLPRELALLFRRVQDDLEAGDISHDSLPSLLVRLDDAEIEAAAVTWGLKVVPGIGARDDLTRRLLRQIAAPGSLVRVVSARRRDAARLWQRVHDEPDGTPVRLEAAAADAGLGGDDPRTAERLRAALDELESALLVWHAYRPDGSRWLFVPTEIRAPAPPAGPALPPLVPVPDPPGEALPWRHPDALAWDLLTLLRDLVDPDAPPWPAGAAPHGARLRHLNQRFWVRGWATPPAGYVDFLISLALAEGLLHPDDHESSALTLTPAVRAWRERSFPAQTERLRWWWLASVDWIEGRARGEVEVWGADWPAARRLLLAALAEPAVGLELGAWFGLDSLAARVAAHLPDLLGATFTAATARLAGEAATGGDQAAARIAAIAEVVGVELATAFSWFGLTELTDVPGQPRAVRLTATGLATAAGSAPPEEAAAGDDSAPPLVVTPAGAVEVREPTPLRVWALSAFADPERLGPISVYRLSAAALTRALAAGFDLAQVTSFLTKQGGVAVPVAVAALLADWARGYRRVRLGRAVVLTPDDPAAVAAIGRLAAEAGLAPRPLDDGSLLVVLPPDGGGDPAAAVAALLRANGYAPLPAISAPAQPAPRATPGERSSDPSPRTDRSP